MKKFSFNLTAILISVIITSAYLPQLDVFAQESNFVCSEGKILVYRVNSDKYACIFPSTADRWFEDGIAEPVDQINSFEDIEKTPLHPEKMREAVPLPESAKGPQIDFSKGYLVEEIKDGLYWVTDGAYNTMFLTTGKFKYFCDY